LALRAWQAAKIKRTERGIMPSDSDPAVPPIKKSPINFSPPRVKLNGTYLPL
jgi:hypothetical protein